MGRTSTSFEVSIRIFLTLPDTGIRRGLMTARHLEWSRRLHGAGINKYLLSILLKVKSPQIHISLGPHGNSMRW
jgi:hypothetical protein